MREVTLLILGFSTWDEVRRMDIRSQECHCPVEQDVERATLLDHNLGEVMVEIVSTLVPHVTLSDLGGRRGRSHGSQNEELDRVDLRWFPVYKYHRQG